MKASWRWIRELSGVDASAAEMRDRFAAAGVAIDAVELHGEALDRVVVAEVRGTKAHPKRENLSLVTIFDGEAEQEVVCGAPNVPAPGGRVLFARLGAKLPNGMEIAERPIAGVTSRGMICSEVELAIGAGEAGIVVLEPELAARVKPGDPIADALGLRDAVFEVDLTPNRPDCLGHIGLARELALLYGVRFAPPSCDPPARTSDAIELAPIEIDHPDRCPRYGAGFVDEVAIGPSPLWLRHRLHVLGLRSVSNVVDATNLVLLEWGHPIHAFDRDLVRGDKIVVRRAKSGEKMKTLDGVERTFTDDDLLICDGEGPVAVAGVMGGQNSEIRATTRRVLIEVAYFDPRSVRRTSRRLGLHTEASHRFERGVDPNAVPAVLTRAISLIANLGHGVAARGTMDAHPAPVLRKTIALRPARLNALLGTEVPEGESRRILEGVGCGLGPPGDAWEVTVPTHRPDILREVDLIEEVARVRGYDRIPTVVPHVRPSTEGTPKILRFVRRLREQAAAVGLSEAINYAFLAPKDLELARVSTRAVALVNPLSEERSVLRTSLLPGLAGDVRRSLRHQADRATLFELAHVFHPTAEELPDERRLLAILLAGPRREWIADGERFDFHDAKGAVEAIVRPVLGTAPDLRHDDALDRDGPFLHPRRRARISVAGIDVGALGELHPDVVDALELGGRCAYAELDVDRLFEAGEKLGVARARPLPKLPAAMRDLAVIVEEGLAAAEVAAALREAAGGLAEEVRVFDLYRGPPVPAGKKSLAFRLVYRDPEATLTDKRVDAAHAAVVAAAEKRFGAQQRR